MRLSNEDDSEKESCSIQNQRDLLYDFIRNRQEFAGCLVSEFCDDGYSGMNFNRPGIQKLLSLAGKTVNCIIVKDFSRFGRNLIEVGDYLDQVFPFLGVRFIAVNEEYDSKQSSGSSVSLEVSLKAMIYEMYSRDISEKIRCVQQAKMRKGEYLCGIAFYGYKRSETEKNKLEVDASAAEVVCQIFNMAAEGMRPSRIAAELNQKGILSPLMYRKANHTDGLRGWTAKSGISYWTRENIRRILLDERYTGCLISHKRTVADLSTKRTETVSKENWIVARDTHTAIVSKDIFREAQRVLRHNTSKKLPKKSYQCFQGLLKCAYCKRSLLRMVCKRTYFCCPVTKTVPGCVCTSIYLEEQVLKQVLLKVIQLQIFLDSESISKTKMDMIDGLQREIKTSQLFINRCNTLQATVFEDYAEGRVNRQEYFLQKQKIRKKQKEEEIHLTELSGQLLQLQEQAESIGSHLKIKRYTFIKELTREILVELIKEIQVSGTDMIEIQWNFKES